VLFLISQATGHEKVCASLCRFKLQLLICKEGGFGLSYCFTVRGTSLISW